MAKSSDNKPSIVLVHGAFADASCWQKVILLLEKRAFSVTAVQLPLKSLADDIATAKRMIEAQKGDVILVGHSYGGAVISGAATGSEKVKALVYTAAFAPDKGESPACLLQKFPPNALATALVPDSAGFLYIDRAKFRDAFAHDVTADEASVMAATQKPLAASAFSEPAPAPAWKEIRSWYAVSTQDNSIPPDLERFFAKRMGATTREIKASHVAIISQPAEIVNLIEAAVETAVPVPA